MELRRGVVAVVVAAAVLISATGVRAQEGDGAAGGTPAPTTETTNPTETATGGTEASAGAVAPAGDAVLTPLDGSWAPTPLEVLPPGPATVPIDVAPRGGSQRALPRLSDLQVSYVGFGPKGKEAFEYATVLWERLVRSPVPIRVRAEWTDLPGDALASAGSNGSLSNFAGAPRTATAYPMALADARAGRDLVPGAVDIVVRVDSDTQWRTSTDGSGTGYDLVSVVLHELAHGLGFTSTFGVSGGSGTRSSTPSAYDRFVTDASGARLVDLPNGSSLAAKLQSDALRFSGSQAMAAFGGARVPIHAPNPFEPGSSISHLAGMAPRDSLMEPTISPFAIKHDPGDIALGVLRDLGWTTTGVKVANPATPALRSVSAGNSTVDVTWSPPAGYDRGVVVGYTVERFVDGSPTPASSESTTGTATTVRFDGLANGSGHRFRVRAHGSTGSSDFSPLSEVVRPLRIGPFANVDAFLNQQYLEILFRAPSSSALASRRSALNAGSTTPGATVTALLADPTHTSSVPPTIRLYLAYFTRLPDQGGLAYWSRKAREGTSLHRASEQFARSSEFQRTYGSLTNGAFVDLVYRNVLGRAPDPGGRTYWVGKLAKGFPRGSMMITVSESSENVRKTQAKVDVVGLQHALMRRVLPVAAVDADVARLAGGTTLATLAEEIVQSRDYSRRIRGVNPSLPIDLAPASELAPVTQTPTSIATGDIDGDGHADVVASLPALLVRRAGPSATNVITSETYAQVELGDVDDDDDLDLVARTATTRALVVRLNDGSGAFGAATTVTAEEVATFAVGDVTGDGVDDVVTSAPADDGMGGVLRVHQRAADGSFTTATRSARASYDAKMEIGDVTGDGRADVAMLLGMHNDEAGDFATPALQVVRQLADGTLGAPTRTSFADGSEMGPLVLADTTGDGVLDLVAGVRIGFGDPSVRTWRATTGTPVQQSSRTVPDEVVALAAADVTEDGRTDVVSARYPDLAVFVQSTTGGLAAPVSIPTGAGWTGSPATPGGAGLVDLDLDGYLDLVSFGGTGFRSALLVNYQR